MELILVEIILHELGYRLSYQWSADTRTSTGTQGTGIYNLGKGWTCRGILSRPSPAFLVDGWEVHPLWVLINYHYCLVGFGLTTIHLRALGLGIICTCLTLATFFSSPHAFSGRYGKPHFHAIIICGRAFTTQTCFHRNNNVSASYQIWYFGSWINHI